MACFLKNFILNNLGVFCDTSSFTHVRPFVASNRLRKPSVRDSVPFSFIMTLYVAGLALACFSFDPWPS